MKEKLKILMQAMEDIEEDYEICIDEGRDGSRCLVTFSDIHVIRYNGKIHIVLGG